MKSSSLQQLAASVFMGIISAPSLVFRWPVSRSSTRPCFVEVQSSPIVSLSQHTLPFSSPPSRLSLNLVRSNVVISVGVPCHLHREIFISKGRGSSDTCRAKPPLQTKKSLCPPPKKEHDIQSRPKHCSLSVSTYSLIVLFPKHQNSCWHYPFPVNPSQCKNPTRKDNPNSPTYPAPKINPSRPF